jgi:hypothetical protein
MAARVGFWLGTGSTPSRARQASGWFARVERLIEREGKPCAISGYLRIPQTMRHLAQNEFDPASACAEEAARIGEQFGEADLVALARSLQGRAVSGKGKIREGLALLDEAMVTVRSDGDAPIVPAIVYCILIEGCRQVVRPRPLPGVDGGPHQLVRVPATSWCLQRGLHGAPVRGAWR